jgi:hypothetical protein
MKNVWNWKISDKGEEIKTNDMGLLVGLAMEITSGNKEKKSNAEMVRKSITIS